jgi:uncharacterized UPF0160 family protein
MATAILKEIFQVELVRTRDAKVLAGLDIVYDVGGGEFDHHDLEKEYRENGIPYASSGLIWRKFGREVIQFKAPDLNEAEIDSVFNSIDRSLIEGIDALDNGMRPGGREISVMSITSIISGFNPPWNSEKNEDELFHDIVEIAGAILRNSIDNRIAVLEAKEHVLKAYETRTIPEVLILDIYCPYGETLQNLDTNREVLYVVYPRKDSFALQTVRGNGGLDRKKLPEAWAGKRDKSLAEVTGVSDATFCHSGRFLAVAGSYEGIMKLARLAVEEPVKEELVGLLGFIKKLFRIK